jgi:DNA-binding MarR family transcriptional regulator
LRPSLPTALSQALIAFTIEFDNEFEHRIEHRTGNKRGGSGVWLTSMVMWSNFIRLIPPEGVALAVVRPNSKITNFAGLQRWRYVTVEPDQTVQLTSGGRRAQEVWQPLAGQIEQRWRERFGDAAIDELRHALGNVAGPALPAYLPVVRFADGMRASHVRGVPGAVAEDLAALLSQPLLAFTLEYEEESEVSLAIGADVLRVLSADGVSLRDLPALSGVSKEAITAAINFLRRQGYAVIQPDPARRSKLVRLTAKGLAAQEAHRKLVKAIEQRWRKRLGGDLDRLTKALISGRQLALGLQPYQDGWRAARNPYRRQTQAVLADPVSALPRYPMVTHRGGYPDGS